MFHLPESCSQLLRILLNRYGQWSFWIATVMLVSLKRFKKKVSWRKLISQIRKFKVSIRLEKSNRVFAYHHLAILQFMEAVKYWHCCVSPRLTKERCKPRSSQCWLTKNHHYSEESFYRHICPFLYSVLIFCRAIDDSDCFVRSVSSFRWRCFCWQYFSHAMRSKRSMTKFGKWIGTYFHHKYNGCCQQLWIWRRKRLHSNALVVLPVVGRHSKK